MSARMASAIWPYAVCREKATKSPPKGVQSETGSGVILAGWDPGKQERRNVVPYRHPTRREEPREAPGGHGLDRVPVRPGAAAGPGIRHQAATGRRERRAALRGPADRSG